MKLYKNYIDGKWLESESKDIISFNINPSQKIILIKLKNNLTSLKIVKNKKKVYDRKKFKLEHD